jgi:hypothetical protein
VSLWSSFLWSISIFTSMLCEIFQNLTYTWLSKLLYGNPTNVPLVSSLTQEPSISTCPNHIAIQESSALLPPLLDSLVGEYILPCLLITSSMLWWLHRVSKAWFKVVGEILIWNAFEITQIDHRSYLRHIALHGIMMVYFQECFKFELFCL